MSIDYFDMCNKTVPIYSLRGKGSIHSRLHTYIFNQWFRPYQSEIEYGRYICKLLDKIIALHRAFCAEVGYSRFRLFKKASTGKAQEDDEPSRRHFLDLEHLHVLQPLFRALIIVIPRQEWNFDPWDELGCSLSVVLVITGVTDGLSAPISFGPIAADILGYIGQSRNMVEVKLEVAINFVMDLEARERKAFGLKPDPVGTWSRRSCEEIPGFRDVMGNDFLDKPPSHYLDRLDRWKLMEDFSIDRRNMMDEISSKEIEMAKHDKEWEEEFGRSGESGEESGRESGRENGMEDNDESGEQTDLHGVD